MKLAKQSYFFLISFLKSIKYSLYQPNVSKKIFKNVEYFSQWESPKLVEKIVSKSIDARQDPDWQKSGTKDKLEYLHWSWSTCGLACLRMVINHSLHQNIPSVTLAKECLKGGIYTIDKKAYDQENYRDSISDLKYLPFVNFINKNYTLKAKIVRPLVINEIIQYLDNNYYVIASVNPQIRFPNIPPAKKGSHLVLFLGYDFPNQKLIFHNPSGYYQKSQIYNKISFTQFKKFFNYRGIVIKKL